MRRDGTEATVNRTSRDLEDLDTFREAAMDMDAIYSEFPRACGLSYYEYWSLVLIGEGCDTQRDICLKISCNKQTLNSAFKLLHQKGLIDLISDMQDHRSKRAVLTNKGKTFCHRYIDILYSTEENAWKRLTMSERATLTRLTELFTAALSSELAAVQQR